MNIKRIKLADVKPAAYNPRRQLKPGEKEYEALKASISRWSLVEPLVVNLRTGNLVGGHQRYNVLLDLGHTEAEAAVVDLDEKQEKLLNVALNRIEGQWDYEKLQDLFEEFSAEDILERNPYGSERIPTFMRISFIKPEVPLNIQRHIIPMIKPETAHGKKMTP